jgi:hypothetical protein
MKLQRMMAALAIAVAVLAVVVQAADLTGKWTGAVPTRDGGTRDTAFNFKQDGEKLTGTMAGPQGDVELKDGAVKGDEVSFNVALSFNGNDVKLVYKGKVAGDEIKMTRTREGGNQPPQEFTLKRAK